MRVLRAQKGDERGHRARAKVRLRQQRSARYWESSGPCSNSCPKRRSNWTAVGHWLSLVWMCLARCDAEMMVHEFESCYNAQRVNDRLMAVEDRLLKFVVPLKLMHAQPYGLTAFGRGMPGQPRPLTAGFLNLTQSSTRWRDDTFLLLVSSRVMR